MKFSKFNVYKKYNDQEYWVFNTLTTALIILENEKFMKYFINQDLDNGSEDVNEFLEMGFLIEDNFNELEYLEELRKTVVNSNKKIADIGCGGGAFLDFLYSVADEIIAIIVLKMGVIVKK